MSDTWGARAVMYWVFGLVARLLCACWSFRRWTSARRAAASWPRPTGRSPQVSDDEIVVRDEADPRADLSACEPKAGELVTREERRERRLGASRVRRPGRSRPWWWASKVRAKELLARGVTEIFFQANVWIFTVLSLILGAVMGIGKAAVYKHIPDYFPNDVGVVGGIVGVLGGLGGFVCPVIFGYLLQATGLWTTCWMFFLVLVAVCLVWMHFVVVKRRDAASAGAAD